MTLTIVSLTLEDLLGHPHLSFLETVDESISYTLAKHYGNDHAILPFVELYTEMHMFHLFYSNVSIYPIGYIAFDTASGVISYFELSYEYKREILEHFLKYCIPSSCETVYVQITLLPFKLKLNKEMMRLWFSTLRFSHVRTDLAQINGKGHTDIWLSKSV